MKPTILGMVLLSCTAWLAWGQPAETAPKFEIADVHASPKTLNAFVRAAPAHGGRYEIKTATMVDLIRLAYGFDPDKILGGPNWLEMDRFDILAKAPEDTTTETQKLMLQSLLADRFKLVVHKDTQPLPTYALGVGKKPLLKPAEGSEETGCKPQSAAAQGTEGSVRMMFGNENGIATTVTLGPGAIIQYNCRNMTMAAFAVNQRSMMGTSLGANPVLDETGLKGGWNFDLKYSLQMVGMMVANTGERISLVEAVDKQLGLKLEEKQVPTPVMVVDSVNEKPSDNQPNLAELLPPIPVPTEFEVASIKSADPNVQMSRYQMQPGGRLNVQGMPLRFLISRAFNSNNNDQIVGLPVFVDTERFDVIAKAPSSGPSSAPLDGETMAPMMRSLLADRFKMTYHTEDRQVSAYSLVSAKPKMKKSDPASRTACKNSNAPPGSAPGTRVLNCQNITMAQFADRLQNQSPELRWPVLDATGIEGGWDFSLTYSPNGMAFNVAGRGGDAGAGPVGAPSASDPTGGYTLLEAIEKQLGLKLELQKRSMPVVVIDHIEQKPTEN